MKEEEAKTKWCPHGRKSGANNRTVDGIPATNCIASDCMMWIEETSTNCSTGVNSACGGHCGLTK